MDGKPEEKIKRIVDKWVRDKGKYVVKVDYTENVALVGPQNDGVYKQVFLFEGVDAASLVDKSVEPIEIEIL